MIYDVYLLRIYSGFFSIVDVFLVAMEEGRRSPAVIMWLCFNYVATNVLRYCRPTFCRHSITLCGDNSIAIVRAGESLHHVDVVDILGSLHMIHIFVPQGYKNVV